jgi:dTDP-4-amino-4,6-dideoxy-D-galactose acyltransferase
MKKLIITSDNKTKYSKIISRIKKLQLKNVKLIHEKDLNLKILNNFDIIIFENLKKNLLRKAHQLKIILIRISKFKKYDQMIDIIIDPFFKVTKKNNINPIKGSFRPIQLDVHNDEDFRYILNVITIMDWDTNYWKKKISYIGPKRLTDNIIFRINKFVKINKIEMVQFLSNCHDAETVKIAEKNDFGFKDIRITLEKKIDTISKKIINKKNISFRKATLKDFQIIKPIAKNSYLDSRYYFDSLFPLEKVKNFYIGWLKKGILGTFDTFCLLICYKKKPIGFCTIKIQKSVASIGLFSISQNYQKQGFSKILLSAVNYEISKLNINKISVVTQGRNYSALKAYQGSNFKISKTELWYHKWISSNK